MNAVLCAAALNLLLYCDNDAFRRHDHGRQSVVQTGRTRPPTSGVSPMVFRAESKPRSDIAVASAPNAAQPNPPDPIAFDPPSPEDRALTFLVREVPAWHRENRCHSCHNNGDAARALFLAVRLGRAVDRSAVDETTKWLAAPEGWENNGGAGPFNDRQLARLQFTTALAAALEAKLVKDRAPLDRAAERLAKDQEAIGAWPIEGDSTGTPATYGRPLATVLARELLNQVDARSYQDAIAHADRWLLALEPKATPEAAAILLRTSTKHSAQWTTARQRALDVIRRNQNADGGWGPYRTSPPEAFDSALALLALRRAESSLEVAAMVRRGREFLIAEQRPDGSWPETTRQVGGESYAQRISTAGWATMALMQTGK
jgi:Squalene-hopene cyclase N-terminal domain